MPNCASLCKDRSWPSSSVNALSTSVPVSRGKPYVFYSEADLDKMAWLLFRRLTDIPVEGLKLSPGSLSEQTNLRREFRNFLRQGKTYWDAGAITRGSAAALPYYYGALNIAKAELLITNPREILEEGIHHGLSLQKNGSGDIKNDVLVVHDGVFKLLYAK